MSAALARRHDLDWIRVGAFLLLILYHVGMFYVPWDWHVKSPHPVKALEPIMMLTNPWRLTLLFLVSGAASRFLFDSLERAGSDPARRFAASRLLRLAPPLIFAVLVVVPPQSYYEVYEALSAMGVADPAHHPWMQDFWLHYATASGHWCDEDGCLITPTWNHMWFVAYLLVYSLLLAVGAARLAVLQPRLERMLKGRFLLILPILWLAAIRLTLAPRFPQTNMMVGDWYNHALSLSAFLFGFVSARSEVLRAGFMRLRHAMLALAFTAWSMLAAFNGTREAHMDMTSSEAAKVAMRVVYAVDQWAFIAAALGYGAVHLTKGGPALRYLTAAVFPAYLIHQTIIVVTAHNLAALNLPQGLEAGLVIAATLAGCALTVEIARRIGWLGILLGAPLPKKA